MSSNTSSPNNQKVQQVVEEETSIEHDEQQSYHVDDYETVHRSGIDVMTQTFTNFGIDQVDVDHIPALPGDLCYDTIATRFVNLSELHESLAQYFASHPSATCVPDEDPRYSNAKLYGMEQHGDAARMVFMINIYRNDVNDELHLDVSRIEGCGIQFSRFFKAIADEFSVKTLDIWTFDQPTLLSLEDDKDFEYTEIPLYESQTALIEGMEVILPVAMDDF